MKLMRFMCAAALTVSMVGAGAGAVSSALGSAGESGRISAQAVEKCKNNPDDTEWSSPATTCPKVLT
ncbi:hypothetical protein ACIRQY_13665 [Streptomyces sp. NPDC101490]|uniref:hypothetical protein n=1 Tax=unclassified Streptomyces TaxID=2593676 RepID=UPI00332AA6E5